MNPECFARCEPCGVDFSLGVVVPCPLSVYIAALSVARCPTCGQRGKNLSVYEPGAPPTRANLHQTSAV